MAKIKVGMGVQDNKSMIKKLIKRIIRHFIKKETPEYYPRDFLNAFSDMGKITSGSLAKEGKTEEDVNIVDMDRALVLYGLCEDSGVTMGNKAECGVYKGGTAILLAEATPFTIHLFDSFEGFPDDFTEEEKKLYKAGNFGDATIESVKRRLAGKNCVIHKGFFKDTLNEVKNLTFSFVHIDVDIYSSAKECTEFFYPRMEKGGYIVYDDYGFSTTRGVRDLVNEFYCFTPETPIILPTGQCLIVKK